MNCFRCNTIEIFIFLLKHCQRNRLFSLQYDISSLRPTIVYGKHFRKDAAFLHFRLKESPENVIFQ